MKNVLTLIFTVLMGCTSVACATDISSIERKYNNTKFAILSKCEARANYVKKITAQRNVGIPQEAVINWIMDAAKQEMKEKTMVPPLNTADVLGQIMLVAVIYNNPNITTEAIYKQEHDSCTEYYFTRLDMIYKYKKLQLESKE